MPRPQARRRLPGFRQPAMRGRTMIIRSIIWAVSVGALLATAAFLGIASQPAWRNAVASWLGATDRPDETALAFEDMPICSAKDMLGSQADWAQLDPDFAAGKKAMAAEDWNGAITALRLALMRDPRNADILNYIGYAHRRLRQWGPAMQHYQQALAFNPRHRGANGHLGELYLLLDDLGKAEGQRAALQQICLIPCVELDDLERAIAMYGKRASR
jgi:tetratricopeptide (TPR) repeat protein